MYKIYTLLSNTIYKMNQSSTQIQLNHAETNHDESNHAESNQRRVLGSIVYWKEYTRNMTKQLILRENEREKEREKTRRLLDVMVSIPMALGNNNNDEIIALTTNNNERDF